jgi:hypothetical protein
MRIFDFKPCQPVSDMLLWVHALLAFQHKQVLLEKVGGIGRWRLSVKYSTLRVERWVELEVVGDQLHRFCFAFDLLLDCPMWIWWGVFLCCCKRWLILRRWTQSFSPEPALSPAPSIF